MSWQALLIVLAASLGVAAGLSAARLQDASLTVQGGWNINRELTPVAELPDEDDRRRARPPSGGSRGGFPPMGGLGGGPGGMMGSARGPSEKERRKMNAVYQRLQEVPHRLVISIDGERVQIIDAIGRTTTLIADGKKQARVTGDGEFTSQTRFEGHRLVVEEDFGGPKVTTRYEPLLSAEVRRLEVTIQVQGVKELEGTARGGHVVTRIYDLER